MMRQVPKPYEHQLEADQFVSDKRSFAFIMEQGTGKSKLLIMVAHRLFISGKIDCVIVVCPNNVKHQWVNEQFLEHYPDTEYNGIVWEGGKTQRFKKEYWGALKSDKLMVFSINIEALQWDSADIYFLEILKTRKCLVAVDESTRIKNGRRRVRGKRDGAIRANKMLDWSHLMPYKAIMTGTPFKKRPFDLWSQYEFLCYDFFGMSYTEFQYRYGMMIKRKGSTGRMFNAVLDKKTYMIIKARLSKAEKLTHELISQVSTSMAIPERDVLAIHKMESYEPYKNMEELRNKISSITFFKRQDECADLPPRIYEKLYTELSSAQKRIYRDLKKEFQSEYGTASLTIENKVTMGLRLRMVTGGLFPFKECVEDDGKVKYSYIPIAENSKLKLLEEDLEDVPDDISIIIWAKFRGEVDLITSRLKDLGYSVEKSYSGSSESVMVDFKQGKFQILVTTPKKNSEGQNLQIASLMYFYSNPDTADDRMQCEKRSHRSGQEKRVLIKDLIVKDTFDEPTYLSLKSGEDLIVFFQSGPSKEIFF